MRVEISRVPRRPPWPLWAVLVAAGMVALVALAMMLGQRAGADPPLCLMKRLTGVPCPTCGATRGGLALLRGRAVRAWLFNPLLFTLAGLWAAATLLRVLTARKLTFSLTRPERILVWSVLAALFAANWAYVIAYVH
ncbi:MAG TPA: DUF2752 domain-containing protein [Phycisphaerae bacterium]|nr:DUF2752 domain-containing protein [Phycisphaerae bacterium]